MELRAHRVLAIAVLCLGISALWTAFGSNRKVHLPADGINPRVLAPAEVIDPPSNLRVFLTLPPSDTDLHRPIVRATWNLSRTEAATGYEVSLVDDSRILTQHTTQAATQSWSSGPIDLTYPGPRVQVRAIVDGRLSTPIQGEVPLGINYAGILAQEIRQTQLALPPATVTAIAESPVLEQVWVGTEGGLAQLEPASGRSQWFNQLDGLAGNHIYALVFSRLSSPEADLPALWVATDGGLTRVTQRDGRISMETFDYTQDISGDLAPGRREITTLFEDMDGVVWIGTTAEGLIRFDPSVRDSRRFTTSEGLPNDTVWSIVQDSGSRSMWLGTNDGLCGIPLGSDVNIDVAIRSVTIRAMLERPRNRLLLVTPEKILEMSPYDDLITSLHSFSPQEEPRPGLVAETQDGQLWIGTQAGLRGFRYGGRRESFRPIHPVMSGPARFDLARTEITALTPSRDGKLWVGLSDGRGLVLYDPGTGSQVHFPRTEAAIQAPVNMLQVDATGALWIASDRGLARWTAEDRFTSVRLSTQEIPAPLGATDTPVLSLTSDERGTVWLGLKHGGVRRIDNPAASLQSAPLMDPKNAGNALTANALVLVGAAIYVGTESQGIRVFGPNTGEEYLRWDRSQLLDALPSLRVLSMIRDRETLWVGTARGLIKLEVRQTGQGQPLASVADDWDPSQLPERLRHAVIYHLFLDPARDLWVASSLGVWRHRRATLGRDVPWESVLTSAIDSDAFSLKMDGAGYLWVGTGRSLFRSRCPAESPNTCQDPVRVLSDQGRIRSIEFDRNNLTWIGTDRGLVVVPPFSNLQRATRQSSWGPAVAAIVALTLVIGIRWARRRRHPIVQMVSRSPEALTRFRLTEVANAASVLRKGGTLQPTLAILDLDKDRWGRVLEMAAIWPGQRSVPDAQRCARIVRCFADIFGAEVLPGSAAVYPQRTVNLDGGYESTTGEFTPLDDNSPLDTLEAPAEEEGEGEDGFDVGAPGARQEPIEGGLEGQTSREDLPYRTMITPVAARGTEEKDLPIERGSRFRHAAPSPAGGFPVGATPGDRISTRTVRAAGEVSRVPEAGSAVGTGPVSASSSDEGLSEKISPAGRISLVLNTGPTVRTPTGTTSPSDEGALKTTIFVPPELDLGAPLAFILRVPELPIRLTHREIPLVVVRQRLPEEAPESVLMGAIKGLAVSARYVLLLNLSGETTLPALNVTGTRFVPFLESDVRAMLLRAAPVLPL